MRATLLVAGLLGALSLAGVPAAGARQVQPSFHPRALAAVGGRAPAILTGSAAQEQCGTTPGLQCTVVDVPLDPTGAVPGTVHLHVEVMPADGTPRGAVFLIAGGPGQGSAHAFGIGSDQLILYRYLFPGYTLVAYDDRGTGESGALDCPSLQVALTADQQRAAAASCAATIGPSRDFYSTAQHAADLEAVRQALGFDKIALFGVSYGTKLAMAYALAYPDHVERLLLDSVLPPEGPDPYSANVLRALPATLDAFCSDGGCRAATGNFGGDVVALANALAAKPLQGNVLLPNGRTATEKVDGIELLSTVLDADLNPGSAAELPAVVHAARNGNTQPLLRLAYLHDRSSITPSVDLSFALYAATVCHDGPFPWPPDTPPVDRQAVLQAAVAALPPGTLGPFGSWSYRFGNADFCLDWPSPAGGAALGPGPLPDVPVLAVSGGFDMRTPTAGAASVVARFPQGHLLVVPGVGHSVITADPSGCAVQAVHTWMLGGTPPTQCPRPTPFVTPVPALPAPVKPKQPFGVGTTYSIARETIAEAEAAWLTAAASSTLSPVPGVFAGRLIPGGRSMRLVGYSIAPGVALTGTLQLAATTLPFRFTGTVIVDGDSAANGLLGIVGTSVRGALGGVLVGR